MYQRYLQQVILARPVRYAASDKACEVRVSGMTSPKRGNMMSLWLCCDIKRYCRESRAMIKPRGAHVCLARAHFREADLCHGAIFGGGVPGGEATEENGAGLPRER